MRARTGQFAGFAPLRSALHSYRTFTTRGLYFIDRCGGVLFPVALVMIAAYKVSLRVQSERSERLRELTPAARRRGLYFIDRCGGVLFPAALVQNAAYEVSLRVQSERSERLRELTPAARRRELPSAGTHPKGTSFGRSICGAKP